MLFVFYTKFSGKQICYSFSSETIDSHLIATSAIQLSFHVLYNLPVLSRQEQDAASLCPFTNLRTCLHHRIWWRSCSTAPTFDFCVFNIEEPDMVWFFVFNLCFVKWMNTRSSFLNISFSLDACDFSSVSYFVTVCGPRSIIW